MSDPLQLNALLLLERLEQAGCAASITALRRNILDLKERLSEPADPLFQTDDRCIQLDGAYLLAELDQIVAARTLSRSQYYVRRLIRAVSEVKTSGINDINLNRWKTYDNIRTDSLWIIGQRDRSGVHSADYWGNFIPEIPRQMMLRYTKPGEWVLDPFVGCGTTAIEGQRLGRHTIGVELQPQVAEQARRLIASESNPHHVISDIIVGDSLNLDFQKALRRHNQSSVQLVIAHPPYHDIIQFSDDPRDLSNAASTAEFLEGMGIVINSVRSVLENGRYLALVIGDKYSGGEWIPLGFLTMNTIMECGFLLKSIVVKNFEETSGKRGQRELWRYRALAGGFYVFKHEYILIFQKH
jgi:DNA modification methylase